LNSCPISAEPTTLPSFSIRLPCACFGKDHAGDAGHRERIGEAGDQRQQRQIMTMAGRISLNMVVSYLLRSEAKQSILQAEGSQ
jgi:hypothetical protein